MTQRFAKLLVGGLTAAALTAALGGPAFAQVTPQTPTPGKSQVADDFLGALATRLGKSADELRAAVVSAEKDLVDKAAAAGKLTADQAAKAKQRIDQRGGRIGLRAPAVRAKPAASPLADFLKITPRQLGQELKSGQSLAQVAQAHGKSRDELKQFLTAQAKTRLDALVKSGKLTQEQENSRLQKQSANLDKLIDRTGKRAGKSASL